MTESHDAQPRPRYAAWALALLTANNLLNYLERNAIFAVFEPLKRDLSLSDAQLGWLGTAYVLVFSLASLPSGLVGDLADTLVIAAIVLLNGVDRVRAGIPCRACDRRSATTCRLACARGAQ